MTINYLERKLREFTNKQNLTTRELIALEAFFVWIKDESMAKKREKRRSVI